MQLKYEIRKMEYKDGKNDTILLAGNNTNQTKSDPMMMLNFKVTWNILILYFCYKFLGYMKPL